ILAFSESIAAAVSASGSSSTLPAREVTRPRSPTCATKEASSSSGMAASTALMCVFADIRPPELLPIGLRRVEADRETAVGAGERRLFHDRHRAAPDLLEGALELRPQITDQSAAARDPDVAPDALLEFRSDVREQIEHRFHDRRHERLARGPHLRGD